MFPELIEREMEIIGRIARGQTNQEIADEVVLSLKTVRNHVSNIMTSCKLPIAR